MLHRPQFWRFLAAAAPTRSRMAMDSSARESGMSVQEYALLGDRVRADTLLSDRVSSGDQGGMHWVRAAAIQATWSTSSSTVLLPWIFGTLGYVGGPLCLVVFVGLALVVQLKVVELAAEHGAMSDMADVGEALASEPGRRLFRGLLLANQVLFMPCALVFCAHSLRGLAFPKGPPASLACHFYWTMMLVGVAFVVLQSGRRFGHASTLALVTSAMCGVQVACIVAAVLRTRTDDDGAGGYGPWPAADATWAEIFGAAGSIGYVYVPAFVTVDVMREMRAPEEMAKALTGATAYMVAIYVVVGLAPPLRWDAWRVADPVTDGFGASAPILGRAANGLLLVACGLDYLLAALAVNGACRRALVPKLDLLLRRRLGERRLRDELLLVGRALQGQRDDGALRPRGHRQARARRVLLGRGRAERRRPAEAARLHRPGRRGRRARDRLHGRTRLQEPHVRSRRRHRRAGHPGAAGDHRRAAGDHRRPRGAPRRRRGQARDAVSACFEPDYPMFPFKLSKVDAS